MEKIQIVCASDNVKLYTLPSPRSFVAPVASFSWPELDTQQHVKVTPHPTQCTWTSNPFAEVLAISSSRRSLLTVDGSRHTQEGHSLRSAYEMALPRGDSSSEPLSLSVHRNEKYLLVGDSDGYAHLCSLDVAKDGSAQSNLKLKHAYRFVSDSLLASTFFPQDEYKHHFAVGYDEGQVFLCDFMAGTRHQILSKSGNNTGWLSSVLSLSPSPYQPHLLASSHSSLGEVRLLDIARGASGTMESVVHCFRDHSPHHAVTQVLFSPVNDMLCVSCGKDSAVLMYDVLQKRCISRLVVDSPALSVDLHGECHLLAVGMQSGRAMVYDLRHVRSPLYELDTGGAVSSSSVGVRNVRFRDGGELPLSEIDQALCDVSVRSRSTVLGETMMNLTLDDASADPEMTMDDPSLLVLPREEILANLLDVSENKCESALSLGLDLPISSESPFKSRVRSPLKQVSQVANTKDTYPVPEQIQTTCTTSSPSSSLSEADVRRIMKEVLDEFVDGPLQASFQTQRIMFSYDMIKHLFVTETAIKDLMLNERRLREENDALKKENALLKKKY